jgi:outer membrane protein insertion porin family
VAILMKKIIALFFILISNVAISVVKEPIGLEKKYFIKAIEWNTDKIFKESYKNFFNEFNKFPYDSLNLKLKIDTINKELFFNGYLDSVLTMDLVPQNNQEAIIKLNYMTGTRTNFYFNGNSLFSFQELRTKFFEKIKSDLGKVDVEQLKLMLIESYEELGFYLTRVNINFQTGKDFDKKPIKNYIVEIDEGEKLKIESISFKGNSAISSEDLLKLYYENGTSLSRDGFYDKKYIENFTNIIKKKYLSLGYVYIESSRPRIIMNEDDPVLVEYLVNEKSQVKINEINFVNISNELASEIKQKIINQEKKPVNIPELENDFKKVINHLQSMGYYFASISNGNSDDLIKYDNLNSTVDIKVIANLDRKICFNDVVINGNYQTKKDVIERELHFDKNEIIIPEKLENLRQRLSNLGLFSNIRITPYMTYDDAGPNECAKTNIIVQLKERDFGLVEISPGYRTDLGAKSSFGITYNNLGGMNRSASIKAQANQRFNLNSLDARRNLENKKLFEYSSKFSFIEPFLFYNIIKTQLELETSASIQRKRFSAFDADIFKFSPQVSKNFSKKFSTSLKYQLERIIQFDATLSKDNDNYTIGSVTPSFTFDYRDDQFNTRRGGYINISSEWANHYFGSMKNDQFEVNYLKVINRNKFYIPAGNFVFATSLAGGFEKNYAEKFFIPNIKVFRLDGFDEIRGYEDGEINRLIDSTPISKITVYNNAYFVAFKFEPRYNLSDSLQLDCFFDAGRVFINNFVPLNLRMSVGVGIKFLTPVGSLDVDYGVKLKRETYSYDKAKDAMGRLHLSIGFF